MASRASPVNPASRDRTGKAPMLSNRTVAVKAVVLARVALGAPAVDRVVSVAKCRRNGRMLSVTPISRLRTSPLRCIRVQL